MKEKKKENKWYLYHYINDGKVPVSVLAPCSALHSAACTAADLMLCTAAFCRFEEFFPPPSSMIGFYLVNSDGFGEVSGLVGVVSLNHSELVGNQL